MKLKYLLCMAALVAGSLAQAQELTSGTHYRPISPAQPTVAQAGKIEVTEFFQYSCPACYSAEPHIAAWIAAGPPEHIEVVRVHVAWNPQARLHAQAFYTAEALGKSEEMHRAFFDEIHRNGNALDTEGKLAEFFGRFDVTREQFDAAFKSFSVHTNVQRADDRTRRNRVAATPTFVVHGKYVTEGPMATSYENWFENLEKLAALEHGTSASN